MVYLQIEDNSAQAKLMLEYLKSLSFVKVIGEGDMPNAKTQKAMLEAEKAGLKRYKSVSSLMDDLNA